MININNITNIINKLNISNKINITMAKQQYAKFYL